MHLQYVKAPPLECGYVLSLQKVWRTLSSEITAQYLNEIPVKAAIAVERKKLSPVDDEDSHCCHHQRQGFGQKTDERNSLPVQNCSKLLPIAIGSSSCDLFGNKGFLAGLSWLGSDTLRLPLDCQKKL